jgi:hypothetical protein
MSQQLPPDRGAPAVSYVSPVNPLVPGFHLRVDLDGAQPVAHCSGVLDGEGAAAKVQPELMKLHEAIVAAKASSVRLELQEVSYMNSNGIKAFAVWFLKAEGSREHSYAIDLVYNPEVPWQRWSVGALQVLTPRALRLVPKR